MKSDFDELKKNVASKDDVAMLVQKVDRLTSIVTNREDIDVSPRKEGESKGRVPFTA